MRMCSNKIFEIFIFNGEYWMKTFPTFLFFNMKKYGILKMWNFFVAKISANLRKAETEICYLKSNSFWKVFLRKKQ